MNQQRKLWGILMLLVIVTLSAVGCGVSGEEKQVVIYTNADEQAIVAMENALNGAGYEGKYVLQGMGTSELGGKLLAEGQSIEANLVTMSSYFVESAQNEHNMFLPLGFDTKALNEYPDYYTPILANTGAIFYNTEALAAEGLPVPTSVKDLADPVYADSVSVPSIMDSSTAWLMMQSILDAYGEEEGMTITEALVDNCGAHIESSGSGPIKKVRVGEVAIGFGLRHDAVADQKDGKPIKLVDPTEGNFSLTESVAVINSESDTLDTLAMEMAEVIIKDAREALIADYPVALYEGETVDQSNVPENAKVYHEPLTVDLLKEHQAFFEDAMNK